MLCSFQSISLELMVSLLTPCVMLEAHAKRTHVTASVQEYQGTCFMCDMGSGKRGESEAGDQEVAAGACVSILAGHPHSCTTYDMHRGCLEIRGLQTFTRRNGFLILHEYICRASHARIMQ